MLELFILQKNMTPIEQFRQQDPLQPNNRPEADRKKMEQEEQKEQQPEKTEAERREEERRERWWKHRSPAVDAEEALEQPPVLVSAEELAKARELLWPTDLKRNERKIIAESDEIDDDPLRSAMSLFQGKLVKNKRELLQQFRAITDDAQKQKELLAELRKTWEGSEPWREDEPRDTARGFEALAAAIENIEREAASEPNDMLRRERRNTLLEQKIINEFRIVNLTPEEEKNLIAFFRGKDNIEKFKNIARLRLYTMMLEDAALRNPFFTTLSSDDPASFAKFSLLLHQRTLQEKEGYWKKILGISTKEEGNPTQKIADQKNNEKKEGKTPDATAEGIRSVFRTLNTTGQTVVNAMLKQGKGSAVATILSRGENISTTKNGLRAEIEGGTIEVRMENGTPVLYLRSSKGTEVRLADEPLPAAMDQARATAISTELSTRLTEQSVALTCSLMKSLTGIDIADKEFMREDEEKNWHSILRAILGRKGTPEDERMALQELDILGENDKPNMERSSWFRLYLRCCKTNGTLETLNFDQLARVARQWDADEKFSMPQTT